MQKSKINEIEQNPFKMVLQKYILCFNSTQLKLNARKALKWKIKMWPNCWCRPKIDEMMKCFFNEAIHQGVDIVTVGYHPLAAAHLKIIHTLNKIEWNAEIWTLESGLRRNLDSSLSGFHQVLTQPRGLKSKLA